MKRDCWQVGPIRRSLRQLGHKADLEQRVVIGPLDTDGVEIVDSRSTRVWPQPGMPGKNGRVVAPGRSRPGSGHPEWRRVADRLVFRAQGIADGCARFVAQVPGRGQSFGPVVRSQAKQRHDEILGGHGEWEPAPRVVSFDEDTRVDPAAGVRGCRQQWCSTALGDPLGIRANPERGEPEQSLAPAS